jgi:AcrR family transcriptional regulator
MGGQAQTRPDPSLEGSRETGSGAIVGAASAGGTVGEGHQGGEGRPMRADARRNYQRILEAARKVFADQGGGASLEAIARQAGVGVGTLYRHFPKRIDVVEAVYRDDVDMLVGAAERGLTAGDPWAALAAWLRAYVDYGRAKRTFLNELHEAFEKNPDLKPASRDRIWAAADMVLRRAQEAGVARADISGEDLMQLVTPMCMNSTISDEQGERLIRMVLDGLRPAPPLS